MLNLVLLLHSQCGFDWYITVYVRLRLFSRLFCSSTNYEPHKTILFSQFTRLPLPHHISPFSISIHTHTMGCQASRLNDVALPEKALKQMDQKHKIAALLSLTVSETDDSSCFSQDNSNHGGNVVPQDTAEYLQFYWAIRQGDLTKLQELVYGKMMMEDDGNKRRLYDHATSRRRVLNFCSWTPEFVVALIQEPQSEFVDSTVFSTLVVNAAWFDASTLTWLLTAQFEPRHVGTRDLVRHDFCRAVSILPLARVQQLVQYFGPTLVSDSTCIRRRGWTPLHYACARIAGASLIATARAPQGDDREALWVLQYLVQQGAAWNVRDKQGRTPLHCLVSSDDTPSYNQNRQSSLLVLALDWILTHHSVAMVQEDLHGVTALESIVLYSPSTAVRNSIILKLVCEQR